MPKIKIKRLPKAYVGTNVGPDSVPSRINFNDPAVKQALEEFLKRGQPSSSVATSGPMKPDMSKSPAQQPPQYAWSDLNKDIFGNSTYQAPSSPYAKPQEVPQAQRQQVAKDLGIPVGGSLTQKDRTLMPSLTNPFEVKSEGYDLDKGSNTLGKVAGVAAGVVGAAKGASIFVNWNENRKRQRDFDEWMRNSMLPDNYYAVNTTQNRGDYEMNTGMFRPDELGFKSKGMFANPYYARQTFTKYGGMIQAAEGMSIPGTNIVEKAFLADPSIQTVSYPNMGVQPSSSNVTAPSKSFDASGVKLKGNDVATRTNNPGNLLYKPIFGKLFGAVDSGIKQQDGTGTFAAFPSVDAGLAAREAQMFGNVDGTFKSKIYKRTTTVDEALRKWSNNGYNGSLYPEIANKTLQEVTPEERKELLKRQIKAESGSMYKQLKQAGLFAKDGGQISNNNTMKIRIVGLPNKDEMAYGGQPPYSGQSDYGLYIGQRNLYRTMAKHPFKDYGNTVSEEEPTADNPHVLEAEGRGSGKAGETILRPDGSHMNIVGPKHSQGGVKLTKEQAPEGSFIYSDARKLKIKDPEVLKNFGKGGNKAHTPATIAKQYDTNKYLSILQDPNTDPLAKQTARKMLDNYDRKLSELALVQEGMKGFPQGIPDVAKGLVMQQKSKMAKEPQEGEQLQEEQQEAKYGGYYSHGGLHKFFVGGDNPEQSENVILYPGGSEPTPTGLSNKFVKGPQYLKTWEAVLPGISKGSNAEAQSRIYDYMMKYHPEKVNEMWQLYGLTAKGLSKDKKGNYLYKNLTSLTGIDPKTGKMGKFKSDLSAGDLLNLKKAYVDKMFGARQLEYTPNERNITTPIIPLKRTPTLPEIPVVPTSETPDETTPNVPAVPGGDPTKDMTRAGWTSQDIRNAANAAIDYSTLRKYHPYFTNIQPVLPDFVPVDWRGYAASLQSGANTAAQQLATYQPGTSMASNLSFLAGQQGESLGKYISDVDRTNAAMATQNSAQRADILNRFTEYNAQNRDKAWAEENVYDDRYRAAERLARKGIVKAIDQGEDTASKIYNENITQKYFKIDPYTQQIRFKDENARANWEAAIRGGNPADVQQQAVNLYNYVYENAKGNEDQRAEAALRAMQELMSPPDKTSSVQYPYNIKQSKTVTQQQAQPKTSKHGGQTNTGYSYFNPFLR